MSSNIMLVAQDWLSEDYLLSRSTDELVELRRHGQLSQLPTNRNIGFFLENALNLQFSDTYATNLYPFIKQGAISASIPTRDLNWSIENALLPQIDIVKPETVLILGIGIARLVQKHFKRTRSIEKPFSVGGWWKFGQSTYIALPHPGGRATASFGGKDSVAQLWRTSIERAK